MFPTETKKPDKILIINTLSGIYADRTGLEPATSAVTGQHSNQLNYRSVCILQSNECKIHDSFAFLKTFHALALQFYYRSTLNKQISKGFFVKNTLTNPDYVRSAFFSNPRCSRYKRNHQLHFVICKQRTTRSIKLANRTNPEPVPSTRDDRTAF